jgi:hypothetical protein
MHAHPASPLDFLEPPVDVGRGEVHARRGSNHFELGRNLAAGFAPASLDQHLPHPFGNGHVTQPRGPLNVVVFRILNDDLQPFGHRMS